MFHKTKKHGTKRSSNNHCRTTTFKYGIYIYILIGSIICRSSYTIIIFIYLLHDSKLGSSLSLQSCQFQYERVSLKDLFSFSPHHMQYWYFHRWLQYPPIMVYCTENYVQYAWNTLITWLLLRIIDTTNFLLHSWPCIDIGSEVSPPEQCSMMLLLIKLQRIISSRSQ